MALLFSLAFIGLGFVTLGAFGIKRLKKLSIACMCIGICLSGLSVLRIYNDQRHNYHERQVIVKEMQKEYEDFAKWGNR